MSVENVGKDCAELSLAGSKKQKIEPMKEKFVLYAVKREGVIIYVGSGLNGRENHCLSGCSHVYELNKSHFSGEELEVVVLGRFIEKNEALNAEKNLIIRNKPILNKAYNPDFGVCTKRSFQNDWNDYFMKFSPTKSRAYRHLLDELVKFFGVKNLTSSEGVSLVGLKSHRAVPNRIHSFLRCKLGSQTRIKFDGVYDLFMSKPGYIKIPVKPPELKLEEIEE